MKSKIILIIISIILGISFTFFVLNKENIYAKEKYLVYAFQVGAFKKEEYAQNYLNTLPSGIIQKENDLYKVYVAIYKDLDVINKMLVYFEDNDIKIYLKSIEISKDFDKKLNDYEELIKKSEDGNVYNKVNQNILNCYIESANYDKNN